VGEPERKNRVYAAQAPGGTTRHGTNVKEELLESETERFFRAVDRAVLELYSRPSGLPLLLAALPEHHNLFYAVSRNPFLIRKSLDINPDALSLDELRQRAWQLILPHYLDRLSGLIERFGAAKPHDLGGDDLEQVALAAIAGRIEMLLIEAERRIPGTLDNSTGSIRLNAPDDSHVDDLLDDIGEQVLKTGGEVVIVPSERMPTQTGLAAIYRG
jgi:hypothetical protein